MKPGNPRARRETRTTPAAPRQEATVTLAWWVTAGLLLATAWAVDPGAAQPFDAPKRLAWRLGGLVVAGLLGWNALARPGGPALTDVSPGGRRSAGLALAGLAWLCVSALASPRPEQAWPTLRIIVLASLPILAGASRLLDRGRATALCLVFGLATGLNVVISLLQAGGWQSPFEVLREGGRFPTGALLGNEAYVSLTAALPCAGLAGLALIARPLRFRLGALALALPGLAAILVNQTLTALLAVLASLLALLALRVRHNHRGGAGGRIGLTVAGLALALAAGFLTRAGAPDPAGGAGFPATAGSARGIERIDRLSTHRLGAWLAAAGMVAARPWLGHGPGTFAAEYVPRRLEAELRHRVRFLQPAGAFFDKTHNEYLQAAAEWGIPTLACLLGALGLLLSALIRRVSFRADANPEPLVLLALLLTGMTEALAWFPLQSPVTALPLLLAIGRAWRLSSLGRIP